MNWFRDLLTTADNQTHDLGKYSWIGSFLAVLATGTWNLMHGLAMDVVTLANALGIVAGAHAGALWVKKSTEPDPVPPTPDIAVVTVTPAKAPTTGYPLDKQS